MSKCSVRSLGVSNRVICIQDYLSANVVIEKSQFLHICHKISSSGNSLWEFVTSPTGVFTLNSCVGCGSPKSLLVGCVFTVWYRKTPRVGPGLLYGDKNVTSKIFFVKISRNFHKAVTKVDHTYNLHRHGRIPHHLVPILLRYAITMAIPSEQKLHVRNTHPTSYSVVKFLAACHDFEFKILVRFSVFIWNHLELDNLKILMNSKPKNFHGIFLDHGKHLLLWHHTSHHY